MRKRTQAREFTLQLLYQIDVTGQAPKDAFEGFWDSYPAPEDIRKFTERLVSGTVEQCQRIDEIISRYAENWHVDRMAVVDRNILRYATYEILFMDDIPPKVTINEAVNMAKKYSQDESGKFVNGILDKICHSESDKLKKDPPPAASS